MAKARVTIRPNEEGCFPAFSTSKPVTCIVGKSDDCQMVILGNVDGGISRHHCLFDINPPYVTVKDLGSKNGTYVNGQDIRREEEPVQIKAKDLIQLCNTQIRVDIIGSISEAKDKVCVRCGSSVKSEGGTLCDACREDPASTIDFTSSTEGIGARHLIFGYRVLKSLGKGALAHVYLAQKRGSEEERALKLMLPNVAVHKNNRTRFLREVEALQSLQHENVVRIHESGYDNGIFYIALDYCNAGTVEQRVFDQDTLSVNEAIEVELAVLDALHYAHTISGGRIREIVHRDVKPGNILLHESDGRTVVKLADFGLCKAFNGSGLCSFTQTGTVAGTFAFMCRQQLLCYKNAGPQVDVWSAAAVLYFMLTGFTPRGNSFTAILDQKAVPIRHRDPEIPPKLAKVIDKALDDHKDELAFKSAADFKDALINAC